MKKFLKWALIIVVLLIVLYFVHSLITAKIYFDIYTAMSEKVNSSKDFYCKVEKPVSDGYNVTQEIFIKDNVFIKCLKRINTSTNESISLKLWEKYLPNKTDEEDGTGYMFIETTDGVKEVDILPYEDIKEPENKMYRYQVSKSFVIGRGLGSFFDESSPYAMYQDDFLSYTYPKILLRVLKSPTILYSKKINGEDCYAIKTFYHIGNFLFEEGESFTVLDYLKILFAGYTEYVSKETKLPVSGDYLENPEATKLEYFSREVKDEDIKLPNLEEYTVRETAN